MPADTIYNDLTVTGNLTIGKGFFGNNAAIADASISSGAAIQASKMLHKWQKEYAQPGATTAFVERKVVHVVRGAAGILLDYQVGARVANIGAATCTLDLQVNGVSVLSATVSLTSATTAYTLVGGAISSPALVAGNVIEIVVTAATAGGGTLATGLFAQVSLTENY